MPQNFKFVKLWDWLTYSRKNKMIEVSLVKSGCKYKSMGTYMQCYALHQFQIIVFFNTLHH